MKHVPVESSNIHSVGYSAELAAMEVAFKNGTTYRYADVMPTDHAAFMAAQSKGSHFAQFIRSRFKAQKVDQ